MTTPLIMQQTIPGSHGEPDLQERYGPDAVGFYGSGQLDGHLYSTRGILCYSIRFPIALQKLDLAPAVSWS